MKKIIYVALIGILALACKNQEVNPQMKEVMAIHDEVMPKMSDIGKLVAELKTKVDTTKTGKQYQNAMEDLQTAHKSMMDWMQGFGNRFDSDEILKGKELTAQKKEWLNEEEEKVKAMRDQVNQSIAAAEELLGKN